MALNCSVFCRNSIFRYNYRTFLARHVSTSKIQLANLDNPKGSSATDIVQSGRHHAATKVAKISRAMEAYMKASVAKEKQKIKDYEEYEIGKRHLANMMSMDAATMTQRDVNEAIAYLLPSGLYSPRSRPKMDAPEKVGEPEPPQFAPSGRPFDDMFYTTKPTLYQTLYEIQERIDSVMKYEAMQVSKGIYQPAEILEIPAGTWKKELPNRKFSPNIRLREGDLDKIDNAMDYLSSLPYAYLEKEFILTMRETLQETLDKAPQFEDEYAELSPVLVDENGRQYACSEGINKMTTAKVRVYPNGTGKITINGRTLGEMDNYISRSILVAPFIILNRHYDFDVVSTTHCQGLPKARLQRQRFDGINETSESIATRLGMCRAMRSFLNEEEIEKLRLAAYLTRDPRRRERHKFNQRGARAKRKWKKR